MSPGSERQRLAGSDQNEAPGVREVAAGSMRGLAVRPGQAGGRPLHPPLTDFPIAAYVFTAAFDIVSVIGRHHSWAREFWHAGTLALIAGVIICLLTVTTGFVDLLRIPEHGPDVVRTITIHVCAMVAVFMAGAGDLAWRLTGYSRQPATPPGIAAVSVACAIGVGIGAAYGGSLVFRHGIGVQSAASGQAGGAHPAPRRDSTAEPPDGPPVHPDGAAGNPRRTPMQAARHRVKRARPL